MKSCICNEKHEEVPKQKTKESLCVFRNTEDNIINLIIDKLKAKHTFLAEL